VPATRKLRTLEQLIALRRQAQAEGRTVVHCHGCFDIVHPGHIHHLQFARSLGDLLIVSVSSDNNVNKGIQRPLIPDDLRAGSLAALECVDAVYLSPQPTAVELLEVLRPDIYVKGKEYERSVDPRFLAEKETVARHNGRVVFSSGDVVYSSTALINTITQQDPFQDEKLRRLCSRYDVTAASLANLVHRFRGQKVLVIGDYIQDNYHFCDATGIAGEAPMMALRSLDAKAYDGGAGIIASHLAGLGASPILFTSLADDEASDQAQMRLMARGVAVQANRLRRQLVFKHRYLVDQTKLFKVDEGGTSPLDSQAEEEIAGQILAASQGASAVIFSDFGYGFVTAGLLDRVMTPLRQSVPVITADVSGKQSNLLRFRDVDLLCPTEREVRETLSDFSSGLGAVVSKLLTSTGAKQALITMGRQGLVSFDWPASTPAESNHRLRSEYLPALSHHTIDPLGCGDALLATASIALAAGGSLVTAAMLGSLAAAIEVENIGNHAIDADQLIAAIHQRESGFPQTRLAAG